MKHDFFEVTKQRTNNELSGFSDFELVKHAQKDIDRDRMDRMWRCSECKDEISYLDSLLIANKDYVHEFRCVNNNKSHKCNKKMAFIAGDNQGLNSVYFDELFARYQDRMIKESMSGNADSPDEIYSVLIMSFYKIVSQFARNTLKEKSPKWFSSFFWRSIQNRLADIQKTNAYSVRSPQIKCGSCGEYVGQINRRHLMKPGHEDVLRSVYFDVGEDILKKSSEAQMYKKGRPVYHFRCLFLGRRFINGLGNKEKTKVIGENVLRCYRDLHPDSYLKNKVLSTNEKIQGLDGDQIEIGDTIQEDCFSDADHSIEDMILQDKVRRLVSIIYSESKSDFDIYFNKGVSRNEKESIMTEMALDKVLFQDDGGKLRDVNASFTGKKKDFVNGLFAKMRDSKKCRDVIADRAIFV